MKTNLFSIIFFIVVYALIFAIGAYLLVLVIRSLRLYIKSQTIRKEKAQTAKTLGEALKAHRRQCKMTQEFVAESIGVSRQAVSKWETGRSDPSTSNLIALAKLFGIRAEDLLKEATLESTPRNSQEV